MLSNYEISYLETRTDERINEICSRPTLTVEDYVTALTEALEFDCLVYLFEKYPEESGFWTDNNLQHYENSFGTYEDINGNELTC